MHFSLKVTNFNPPHLHLSLPYGVIPFEFLRDFWQQKTRFPALSCGIICLILRLAVLIQYQSVTDTNTDTRLRHIRASIASRGKTVLETFHLFHVFTHQRTSIKEFAPLTSAVDVRTHANPSGKCLGYYFCLDWRFLAVSLNLVQKFSNS